VQVHVSPTSSLVIHQRADPAIADVVTLPELS